MIVMCMSEVNWIIDWMVNESIIFCGIRALVAFSVLQLCLFFLFDLAKKNLS
jgi:hypothetical protein